VLAVDSSDKRVALIRENLGRLNLSAEVRVADAADPGSWWDGRPFDCVVLDAPCTGTGVIRRHPDIKHLRRPEDLTGLAARQSSLLRSLWQTVAVEGHLLYVTCSIFPEENDDQIARFLANRDDLEVRPIRAPEGRHSRFGLQTLPGVHNVDGFYYALLQKRRCERPLACRP